MRQSERITLPPEIVKMTHADGFTANSYESGNPVSLSVKIQRSPTRYDSPLQAMWYPMKGKFITSGEDAAKQGAQFVVLYNPDTTQWLKVVSPTTGNAEKFTRILRESVAIERRALSDAALLPSLADQIQECSVTIGGREVYGFISPHIGPSAEFILKMISGGAFPANEITEVRTFLGKVYREAFFQAAELYRYSREGYFMNDVNPGNILIHENGDGAKVVLIDFATEFQHRTKGDPADGVAFRQPPEAILRKNIAELHAKFARQCQQHSIPFPSLKELEAEIDRMFPKKF